MSRLYMTYRQVIGQCEALTSCQTVTERKQYKGRNPTAIFRSPSTHRPEAYTDLLNLLNKLKKLNSLQITNNL